MPFGEGQKTLSTEDVAQTAWRAFSSAMGSNVPWDFLSYEAQDPWLRLALRAEKVMQENEGRTYREVAAKLHEAAMGGGQFASPLHTLAWEAVTRHLMTLLDADDIADLDALEKSWAEWVAKRKEILVT